jgi:polyisoprenoid-binding protein YceI
LPGRSATHITEDEDFDMTRVHNIPGIAGAALLLCIAMLPARAASASEPSLRLDSARITVRGTTNVHPYEVSTTTATITRVKASAAVAGDIEALAGAIDAFDIAIPAATLTSPKGDFDKNLHKALKTDQHADITFCLSRLERGDAPNAFKGIGKLTIAGVERDVVLPVSIQKTGAALTVKGTVELLMTDYGITPPKAMLGMLKTDPKVTIAFETIFGVDAE